MSRTRFIDRDTTTDEIAAEEYGDSGKGKILDWANPNYGDTGSPRISGTVRKGELLIIPGTPPPTKLVGKDPTALTILIDGIDIPVLSATILRTMDTGADGFTARIAWTPGADPKIDKATRPYGYTRAAAYIGNELLVGGCLYTTEPEMTTDGMTKGLHGFSFTADAIDSHVQPPYEYNNVTLKQLADALLPPLGIKAVFQDVPEGGAFSRVTAHESDSIFMFLSKLAAQRGLLTSSTPSGDMLFLRAKSTSKPVGTLTEDQPMVTGWKARYDGRRRWYAYKCITKGAKKGASTDLNWSSASYGASGGGGKAKPSTTVAFDPLVPRSRTISFHADDTTPGNIHDAAKWKRNRQYVEALTQEFPVTDWYAPDGTLWRENTEVTVISPTLGVPNGYTFLIRAVEYILTDNMRTANLSLVPPEAYRSKDIGEVWE